MIDIILVKSHQINVGRDSSCATPCGVISREPRKLSLQVSFVFIKVTHYPNLKKAKKNLTHTHQTGKNKTRNQDSLTRRPPPKTIKVIQGETG